MMRAEDGGFRTGFLVNPRELLRAALDAARRAYAPYSNLSVGAAAVDDRDRVFTGCNVENASYGLGICAERCALQAGVAAGARRFVAVAVASPRVGPCWPCGACLQVLAEFATVGCQVVVEGPDGEALAVPLGSLLPRAFRLPDRPEPGGPASPGHVS